MARGYMVWSMGRIIILYAFLLVAARHRVDLIEKHYNSEEICQDCFEQARRNPRTIFEFGRCEREYKQAADRDNTLRYSEIWEIWDYHSSEAGEYVISVSIGLSLASMFWLVVLIVNFYYPGVAFSLIVSFALNFFLGTYMLYHIQMVWDLCMMHFDTGVGCYVQTVSRPFNDTVHSLWVVFTGLVFIEFLLPLKTKTGKWAKITLVILSTICILLFDCLCLAKATISYEHGNTRALIFALLSLQLMTEVLLLALAKCSCEKLFGIRGYERVSDSSDTKVT
ncbi:hypothetical protein AAMO2058_001399300 [Amorphochlora amoebiformis]